MSSPISAVVIAFNEERRIASCLKSLQAVADEVILVDSGSTDKTIDIAKELGVKVIKHSFEGHVQQKNFAMRQAQFDWVLSLDADEVLSEELQSSLLTIKKQGLAFDAYSFNRLNNYAGTWLKHGGWYPDRKIRLWNRLHGKWGGLNPHDQVEVKNGTRVKQLKGDILHYTYDSIDDHLQQMKRFSDISAKAYFERGKRTNPIELFLNPIFSFIRDYFFRGGFRDGSKGFTAARINTLYQYWKYQKLYSLQRRE